METSLNLISSFKKGIRVVESCENLTHLKGARNYLDNFLRVFKRVYSDGYMQSTVHQLYAELYLAYDQKYMSFENN